MYKEVFLIPKKGLLVRDAATFEVLPKTGAIKVLNKFWRRRLKCGDVYIQKEEEIKETLIKKSKKNGGNK